jgi:hypothetical protein
VATARSPSLFVLFLVFSLYFLFESLFESKCGGAWGGDKMEQKSNQDTRQLKKVFINHWRHYRHDLLNQIQLVKSYLQLGRMEDVKRSIDQIVVQAKQHSLLSKLSDPELAYDLLTYNYQSAPFYLDVEMTLTYDELDEIADEHNWLDMVKELLDLMEKGSKFMPDRPLPHFSLIFGREEKDLKLCVDFQGDWDTALGRQIMQQLKERVSLEQGKLVEYMHHHNRVVFDIMLPWPIAQSRNRTND